MAETATRPVHTVPHLDDDVQRAVTLVKSLTSAESGALPTGTERMPKEELAACAGLLFTTVAKAGFGLSFEQGRGFVVAKLPAAAPASPSHPWTWSAPLFVTVAAGGLGATLGFAHIDSVTILDTPEAVISFKHRATEVDTALTAAAGPAAVALPATAANLSQWSLGDKKFTYSVAKGLMVDVSFTGVTFAVDAARNAAAYGELASPAAVLEGGLRPPPAMGRLYETLDAVIGQWRAERREGGASQ